MKKKLILIVSCFFLGISSIQAASNPYPQTQTFDGVVSTPCTRVVWQEVYDRLKIALPSWGNAVNWYKNAADVGYQVGREAKPNSIAVYSGYYGYGHVAYVVEVYEETMKIIENNSSEVGKREGTRSKGIGSGSDNGIYLIGFIYVNEPRTQVSSPSTSSKPTQFTKSSNSFLKTLKMEGIDFSFTKDTFSYFLEVPYETNEIIVSGEVEDQKSTATGFSSYPLVVGDNEISIKVIAEDESSSTYNILITRKEQETEKQEDTSSNSAFNEQNKEEDSNNDKQDSNVSNFLFYVISILFFIVLFASFYLLKKIKKNE